MGSYTGTLPTLLSGQIPSAADWAEIVACLTAITGPWTPYTPGWTASAGAVAVGTGGSLGGSYRLLGKTLDFEFRLVAGTGASFGTAGANWRFSIPSGLVAAKTCHGVGHVVDNGAAEDQITWQLATGGSVLSLFRESSEFSNTSPFTFGAADSLTVSGTVTVA